MTAHRLPRDLAFNDYHVRRDPGAGGTLPADMSLVTFSITTAAAEGRTLADPERAGIRITIVLSVDGGDLTLTPYSTTIVDGTTVGATVTLDDAGDALDLVSIRVGTTYKWLVVANAGCTLNA